MSLSFLASLVLQLMTFYSYMNIFGFSLMQSFNSLSYRFCLELGRNGALMAKLELSFYFSNYLTQVNRFFNPLIQQFAATGNPGKQRLFKSLCWFLRFFFSCRQIIFYPLLEKYFVSNFLKTDVSACPLFFFLIFITIRNLLFIELISLLFGHVCCNHNHKFLTVTECIIQCIVPYIKSILSSGVYCYAKPIFAKVIHFCTPTVSGIQHFFSCHDRESFDMTT